MTISVKHSKVTAKVDGGDSTLLRPSDWNAEHVLTLAADKLLGRQTAGTGPAEEIACTSTGRSVIAAADVAAILTLLGVSPSTTGDVKLTLKTAADTGWLIFDDGTFGNAGAGASQRNNADCQSLFTLIFNNISDANAPILTSAGAATTRAAQTNAAAAWAANCRLSLPKALGRAIAIAGSGSGLTARALGAVAGTETHTLVANQIPTITSVNAAQAISVNSPSFLYSLGGVAVPVSTPGSGAYGTDGGHPPTNTVLTSTGNNSISTTYTNASQQSVPIVQPSSFLNAMVKL